MYTQCPECQTVFRLSEEQLAAAGGKVRCGHCLRVFPARENKVESLPAQSRPSTPSRKQERKPSPTSPSGRQPVRRQPRPASSSETEREIERLLSGAPLPDPDTTENTAPLSAPRQPANPGKTAAPDKGAAARSRKTEKPARQAQTSGPKPKEPREEVSKTMESRPKAPGRKELRDVAAKPEESRAAARAASESRADTGRKKEQPFPEPEAARGKRSEPGKEPLQDAVPSPNARKGDELEQRGSLHFSAKDETAEYAEGPEPLLPAALRQPVRRGSGPVAVLFWSFASLLMLALLVAQYAYYDRYELVKNPALRPWLERMCTHLDCRLPPRRDPAAFELQERDVRYHPEYAGALLISGTFVNTAAFAQPFPAVEVLLKDVNGQVVASRRFAPTQYLQRAVSGGELLQPGTEAHLLLEVSDPGNQAVSFEFNFR